ncbi:MAG: hypothetical protein JWM04_2114 [Verrucomicrobiales bacterium]|nr:hypothetical protein [Verrucomicrobiales bacterium]
MKIPFLVCLISIAAASLTNAQTGQPVAPARPAKTIAPASVRAPFNPRMVAAPAVSGPLILAPAQALPVVTPSTANAGAAATTSPTTPTPGTSTTTVSAQPSTTPPPFSTVVAGTNAIPTRNALTQALINNRDQLNANLIRQRDAVNAALLSRNFTFTNSSLGLATTNSVLRQDFNTGTGIFVPTTSTPGTNLFVPTVQTSATVGSQVPTNPTSTSVVVTNVVTSTNQLPGFGLR